MDMNNNRFLILQGEVEQISLMKPTSGRREDPGLLEYLEDIIGSHVYVDQILELEGLYGDIKRHKENEMLLVHDLKKEIESMEEHKDKAIKYMEAEKRGMCLNHLNYLLSIQANKEKQKEIEASEANIEQKIQQMRQEMQSTIAKSKTDFMKLKAFEREKKANSEQLDKIKEKMIKASTEDSDVQAKIKTLISEQIDKNGQIEKYQKEINSTIDENQTKMSELPKREQEMAKISKAREICSEIYQEQMAKIEPEIRKVREKIRDLEEKMAPFDREIKRLDANKKNMVQQLHSLDEKEKKQAEEKDKIEAELADGSKQMEKLRSRYDELEKESRGKAERISIIESKIKEMETKEIEERVKLRSIEERLSERQNRHQEQLQKNVILNYLMQSKDLKQKGMKVYGRIGDLGSIDPKYDVAISSISAMFNSILVDNTITAKECISLLKRDQVGATQLLALNRIMHFKDRMMRHFEAPQGSHRLFDLVKTNDPDVRVAYYQILQDTLVVPDLNYAQKLAYGSQGRNFKVVTLDGEIIFPDGSMSGGGIPRRGLVGSKIKMEDNLSNEDHQKLFHNKDQLISLLDFISKEVSNMKTEHHKLKMELNRAPITMGNLKKEIQLQGEATEHIQNRLRNIIADLNDGRMKVAKAETQREIEKSEKESRSIESQMTNLAVNKKELEDQIVDFGGKDLREAKDKYDQAQNTFQKVEEVLERLKAEVKKNERVIQEKKTDIESLQKQLQELDHSKNLLNEKKTKGEEEFVQIALEEKELKQLQATLDSQFEELTDKAKKIMEDIAVLKQELDVNNKQVEIKKREKEVIGNEVSKIMEDLNENKTKYLQFVANFGIIDELRRMEKSGSSQLDSIEEDPDESREIKSSSKKKSRGLNIKDISPDRDITWEQLRELNISVDMVKSEIAYLRNNRLNMSTNTDVIDLYKEKLVSYLKKNSEFNSIVEKEQSIRSELIKLRDKRRLEFMTGFSFISKTLKSVYQTITNGGDADLELIDSYDPFSEGILFSVRPPHKSWKHMSKLSGGEKTLSSLSLIFALHYYKPTPIYFMDEIDAALDFRNVEIVAKFIKERTKDAQFIVISLRNYMFELASQLVGIYKIDDTTKTISIYPEVAAKEIEEEIRKEQASKSSQANLSQRMSRKSQAIHDDSAVVHASRRKSLAASLKSRLSRGMESQQLNQ